RLEQSLRRIRRTLRSGRLLDVARQVDAVVVGSVDQGVSRLAVGSDGGDPHGAELVRDVVRLVEDRGALRPGVPHALVDIGDLESQVDDAIAVAVVVLRVRAVRIHGTQKYEPRRAGLEYVA